MPPTELLRPDRLRSIEHERPFGWIPCRLLKSDLLRTMSTSAKLLYLHLALAADRQGLSFWGDKRIQETIAIGAAALEDARQQLIDLDLLAFDGHTYQLLSLPHQPSSAPAAVEARSPDENASTEIPEEARRLLRRIFGQFPG